MFYVRQHSQTNLLVVLLLNGQAVFREKRPFLYNQHSLAVRAIAYGLVEFLFTRMPVFFVRSQRYL
jgi:hypothetical protein